TASPRDVETLAEGVLRADGVAAAVGTIRSELLRPGGEASPWEVPAELGRKLRARLVESAPATAREGGIFRDGVDTEVDELRRLRREAASILSGVEAEERARRGIPTLRVKFNNVVGHVFEVP